MAFDIRDGLLNWNNQIGLSCDFSDGKCQLTKESADYQIAMTINSLSTLLLGYKTANQLYRLEKDQRKRWGDQSTQTMFVPRSALYFGYI